MKRLWLFALVLISGTTMAQIDKRINLYGAYVFDDKFDTYYSSNQYIEGKVMGGFQWGAGVEFFPRESYGVELLYYRQDTEANVRYFNDIYLTDRVAPLGVNYIMLAGNRYVRYNEKVEPYGGFMLGAIVYSNKEPEANENNSYTKFGWGVRLGVNIWASDRVALKIQTQLTSAVQGMGGGLYFGTGGGGAGVTSYSTIYQFGLGGGLSFKM